MLSSVPRRAYRAIRTMTQSEPPALPTSIDDQGTHSLAITPIDHISKKMHVRPGEAIQIVVESINTDPSQSGAALLQFIFRDEDGVHCPIEGWPHVSERVREFIYLESEMPGGAALTTAAFHAPPNSETLEIVGHKWKNSVNTGVIDDIIVNTEQEAPRLHTALGSLIRMKADVFRQTLDVSDYKNISIAVHARGSAAGGKAPLRIVQRNSENEELMPISSLPQNERIGAMLLLDTKPEEFVTQKFSFAVDSSAATLDIVGVDWGNKTPEIVGPIEVIGNEEPEISPDEFLANIPPEQPLYVIDTTAPPLGHPTLALRPNNLAFEYAKQGKAVIFLPFGSLQSYPAIQADNLYQVQRHDIDKLIQSLLKYRSSGENYYICSSFPSLQANALAARLKSLGWRVIYEVRDDMEEFNRVGYSKWYHPRLETEMILQSDMVVTVSNALADKVLSLGRGRESEKVHVVPNAVNLAVIERGSALRSEEVSAQRAGTRRVGYVGHLTPSWFDWQLVIQGATLRPEYQFDIVGHGAPDGMQLPANINLLGPRTHEELSDIVDTWQVGIIPFVHSALTRSVDPNKIYEYFAWGLRCVTADMGMVRKYPSTWVYDDLAGFCQSLDEAIASPMEGDELRSLNEFLETASWAYRASTMIGLIEGTA